MGLESNERSEEKEQLGVEEVRSNKKGSEKLGWGGDD